MSIVGRIISIMASALFLSSNLRGVFASSSLFASFRVFASSATYS